MKRAHFFLCSRTSGVSMARSLARFKNIRTYAMWSSVWSYILNDIATEQLIWRLDNTTLEEICFLLSLCVSPRLLNGLNGHPQHGSTKIVRQRSLSNNNPTVDKQNRPQGRGASLLARRGKVERTSNDPIQIILLLSSLLIWRELAVLGLASIFVWKRRQTKMGVPMLDIYINTK